MKHRNSIETWSMLPVIFTGNQTSYDFTTSADKAYGNNQKFYINKYCLYNGDVNLDHIVDVQDITQTYNDARSFSFGYFPTDVDGNQFVDIGDLLLIYNNSISLVSVIAP